MVFVIMFNYGVWLNSYKLLMVLIYEFGYNFGSLYDLDGDFFCFFDIYGNFIMYLIVGEGIKLNENKFFFCSINMIYLVIVNKGWCFVDRSILFCGNSIVELGEECDCGIFFICVYIDNCCIFLDVMNFFDVLCIFRRLEGKVCFLRIGFCCESSCIFILVSV